MFLKAYYYLLLLFLIKEIGLILKMLFSFAKRTFTDYCKVFECFLSVRDRLQKNRRVVQRVTTSDNKWYNT